MKEFYKLMSLKVIISSGRQPLTVKNSLGWLIDVNQTGNEENKGRQTVPSLKLYYLHHT